jgi:quercetin dioxygenase-like cupin family protein
MNGIRCTRQILVSRYGNVPVDTWTLHSEPLHVTLPAIDPPNLMDTTNQPSKPPSCPSNSASLHRNLSCSTLSFSLGPVYPNVHSTQFQVFQVVLQSGARVPKRTLHTISGVPSCPSVWGPCTQTYTPNNFRCSKLSFSLGPVYPNIHSTQFQLFQVVVQSGARVPKRTLHTL